MTHDNNWITDRRPTEADGDSDGLVIARCGPDNDVLTYLHWSHPYWKRVSWVRLIWRHTEMRQPPTPTPRKFASLTRIAAPGGYLIDAIDEDGVAWWLAIIQGDITLPAHPSGEWTQYPPLPAKEAAQ